MFRISDRNDLNFISKLFRFMTGKITSLKHAALDGFWESSNN